MSYLVAEIDVICAGVVIVDGELDETQTQNLCVKIDRLLRIARYRGDVVKTEDASNHEKR